MEATRSVKQARSIATRDKLIAATLDVIYDHGLDAATTQKIIERAGASRGALLHHFPTRNGIVEAAMNKSMSDVIDGIRNEAVRVSRNEIGIGEFVDKLWGIFNHRFMFIAMEHIIESRTNPELRGYMLPTVQRFLEALDLIWIELYRDKKVSSRKAKVALNITLCLIRGMQVQTIYLDDPSYYEELLSVWKNILEQVVEGQLELKT